MIIWCAAQNPVDPGEIEELLYSLATDHSHWRVDVKSSREELETALSRRHPDLLILHHRLPSASQVSGEEFLQTLLAEYPELRVLYLGFAETHSSQLVSHLEGHSNVEYWFGPISRKRLLHLIQRLTAQPLEPHDGPEEPAAHPDVQPLAAGPQAPMAGLLPNTSAHSGPFDATRGLRALRQMQVSQPELAPQDRTPAPAKGGHRVETRVLPAKTVAFWSPNLPTGRTAAHVAAYLSLDPDIEVIALDLDLYAPSMALHLGILRPHSKSNPYELCMSQLIEECAGGKVGKERLDSVLLKAPGFPRLRLLAGLYYTPALSDVSEVFVQNLLQQIRQYYPGALIVCNLSSPFDCVTTYGLLERAHQVIMVGGGDLASAFHLKRYFLQFQRVNWQMDRVALVLESAQPVEVDTLSSVLGQPIVAVVQPPTSMDDLSVLRLIQRPKGQNDAAQAYRGQLHQIAQQVFSKIQTGGAKGLLARILGR